MNVRIVITRFTLEGNAVPSTDPDYKDGKCLSVQRGYRSGQEREDTWYITRLGCVFWNHDSQEWDRDYTFQRSADRCVYLTGQDEAIQQACRLIETEDKCPSCT